MGGGGGGKGKGGGGSTKINGPDLNNFTSSTGTLGDWEKYFLNTPYSMGNYALYNATGGQVQQAGFNNQVGDVGSGIQIGGPQQFGSGAGSSNGGVATAGGGSSSGNWIDLLWNDLAKESDQSSGLNYQGQSGEYKNADVNNWLDYLHKGDIGTYEQGFNQQGNANALSQEFSNELSQLMYGNGLLPNQNAMIDQQTKASQQNMQAQLASMGLGSSTMNTTLTGNIAQQGAAEKGQLVQSNIDLMGKLMEGEQGLSQSALQLEQQGLGQAAEVSKLQQLEQGINLEQEAQQFGQTAQTYTQAAGEQQALWNEAVQGYGLESQFVSDVLGPYQEELGAYQIEANEATAQAQINAGLQESENQAQSQGMSSLFSGLGSIFGGSGGGSGGSSLGTIASIASIAAMFL
jgi:hypothetical protein